MPHARQPAPMQVLRAKLRRRIRALTPADARQLAETWLHALDPGAAKAAWITSIVGGWTQSLMELLAVEIARRMRGAKKT